MRTHRESRRHSCGCYKGEALACGNVVNIPNLWRLSVFTPVIREANPGITNEQIGDLLIAPTKRESNYVTH